MADGGIFWTPSKYRQLERFRLPPFRQLSKSKSRIQNSDFLLLFVEKQRVVRVCPNSEFWILHKHQFPSFPFIKSLGSSAFSGQEQQIGKGKKEK